MNTYAAEYSEYAAEEAKAELMAYYETQDICPSCHGDGDHGFEPDTGRLYVCFGCGGTGKYKL